MSQYSEITNNPTSLYSETMGSFVRTGNYSLEADLIFDSEESLQQWAIENSTILHEGLFKIVIENSELKLFWAVKEESGIVFKLYGGSGGNLTKEINVLGVTVGNIKSGDVLSEGTTFTEFVTRLLVKASRPTLATPSVYNGSTALANTVEVGTKVTGAKATYTPNQGGPITNVSSSISGFLESTTPNTTYSGNTISSSFEGRIKEDTNTVNFVVNYAASTAFPEIIAGNATASKTITGARKYFTGSGDAPTNNSGIRGGSSRLAASTFTYALTAMNSSMWLAIPNNKSLEKVLDAGALNADITSNFKESGTISVDGATANKDAINYKIYLLSGYGPFSDPHTFTFTIK